MFFLEFGGILLGQYSIYLEVIGRALSSTLLILCMIYWFCFCIKGEDAVRPKLTELSREDFTLVGLCMGLYIFPIVSEKITLFLLLGINQITAHHLPLYFCGVAGFLGLYISIRLVFFIADLILGEENTDIKKSFSSAGSYVHTIIFPFLIAALPIFIACLIFRAGCASFTIPEIFVDGKSVWDTVTLFILAAPVRFVATPYVMALAVASVANAYLLKKQTMAVG